MSASYLLKSSPINLCLKERRRGKRDVKDKATTTHKNGGTLTGCTRWCCTGGVKRHSHLFIIFYISAFYSCTILLF